MIKNTWLLVISFLLTLGANAQQVDLKKSPWHIVTAYSADYSGIALANGKIGLLSSDKPFKVASIILNNVYDEFMFDSIGKCVTSRIVKGINFANLEMVIDGEKVTEKNITNWEQTLDMKEARLTTSFNFKDKAFISYTTLALRGMPYCGLIDVNVVAKKDIAINVGGIISSPKEYKNIDYSFKTLRDNEIRMPLLQTIANSETGKIKLSTTATFIFDNETPELTQRIISATDQSLDFSRRIKKGENFHFSWAGAVCTSKDFNDPKSESERMAIYIMRGNLKQVLVDHVNKWATLWQGDIVIDGDIDAQRDVRLALYHLYAFSKEGSDLSISPMGLSSQGYNGHIFWDTELWMFPPVLVFNPEMARSYLNYRFNRLEKAKQKAHNYGFAGAMYPWESDDTGEEATPTFALTGAFEHHITADIGIAVWNYFRTTGDIAWLKEKGYPMLKEIADFWVSRSVRNADGSYSINNVVGADEFAPNVDDNAFTNGAAKTVLENAAAAAKAVGVEPNKDWKVVADNLKFNYFDNGIMKEHKTYNGEIIKQADVNLLAYPLGVVSNEKKIENDLKYYESKISVEGPAMGYSVLSILHARLGNTEEAYELFKKAYVPNKRPPFGALSESPTSNNPYFSTGAGGMLQMVIFGFGGLHFTDNGLIQMPVKLPKNWKKLEIKGVGIDKRTYVNTTH